MSIANIFAVI